VPEISRFFGIVIAMYHREHEPAHFTLAMEVRKAPFESTMATWKAISLRESGPCSSSGGIDTGTNWPRIGDWRKSGKR